MLSQKPSSLFDLRKQIRNLYDDLKKKDSFHIQYKDKEGFWITLQSEQEFNTAIQYAIESKLATFKFYIIPENSNPTFSLLNQDKVVKTPSTASELVPNRKNFFIFDNSNTTSSDEKFTGRESFAPETFDKDKSIKINEEPFNFIRVEEEKNIEKDSKIMKSEFEDDNKKIFKNKQNQEEMIINENAFNKLEKFHNVKCYKCNGAGYLAKKSNKRCKKCNGTGDFTNSKKILVIDYFIKEKLQNIYKEYEQKMPMVDNMKAKFFASENIHNSNVPLGTCTICSTSIENGVKYKCSKCPLLTFCSKCEEKVEHPHPLIKFKKNFEENKLNFSKSVQLSSYLFPSEPLNKSVKKSLAPTIENLEGSLKLPPSSSSTSNYKAKFFNDHFIEKVAAGSEFSILFIIQNNGDCKWPENMELICISGFYQSTSVGVPSLNISEKHSVTLALQAPNKEETLNSSWRLGYCTKNDKKYFGPKINSTVTTLKQEKMLLKEQKDLKKKFMSH